MAVTARLLMTAGQIRADQGGWLEARTRTEDGGWRVTASEMGRLLGIAPKDQGGPYRLYWDKLLGRETGDSAEMQRGRALEPLVLAEWEQAHPGLVLLPGGLYCREEEPWLAATLDAQAIEEDAAHAVNLPTEFGDDVEQRRLALVPDAEVYPVEAKTSIPMDEWGAEDSGLMPDQIRAQALMQAHVRGSSRVFITVKPMLTWAPVITYELVIGQREREEIAWMVDASREFVGRLEREDPPEVDWFPATTRVLRRRFPGDQIEHEQWVRIPAGLARRYKAVGKADAALERRKGLVTNEMLARAGNAGVIYFIDPATGARVKVATRTAGPMPERILKAIPNVDRLNRAGWARQPRREKEGTS